MIFDQIEKLGTYTSIPRVGEVVEYLKVTDVFALPEGDIPIDGHDLFVKVLVYSPKPARENHFEAHRHHTDVQIMFRGVEEMLITNPQYLTPHTAYDASSDFQFFTATAHISTIVVGEGEFVIFSPGDVHKPGCRSRDLDRPVRKLVFKIRTKPAA